jgi:hypothetical protein
VAAEQKRKAEVEARGKRDEMLKQVNDKFKKVAGDPTIFKKVRSGAQVRVERA